MSKKNSVGKKCPHCGKQFTLGVNGIIGTCDDCAGIKRDGNGYAWKPWEMEQTYIHTTTGEQSTVTRSEANPQ